MAPTDCTASSLKESTNLVAQPTQNLFIAAAFPGHFFLESADLANLLLTRSSGFSSFVFLQLLGGDPPVITEVCLQETVLIEL